MTFSNLSFMSFHVCMNVHHLYHDPQRHQGHWNNRLLYFEILEGLGIGLDLIKVNLRIKLNLM